MKLKLNRAIAGYILAGVVMLIGFLYLRFPGEALTDYIKAAAAAQDPELQLSIDTLRPCFPPGLALENVTAAFRGRPETTLHADSLTIRPGGIGLLKGRLSVIATAQGYGGEIKGKVDFSSFFPSGGSFNTEVTLRDLRTEKCAWPRDLLARQIAGTLKGSVTFSGTMEAPKNGAGNADFTLTNGSYQLVESFLGFERLDFSKVEGKLSFRNGALKIAQLTLSGDKLNCSLRGNILLADDFQASQLDLNGTLDIPMQGNKRVTLAISGTIGNPKTRFM